MHMRNKTALLCATLVLAACESATAPAPPGPAFSVDGLPQAAAVFGMDGVVTMAAIVDKEGGSCGMLGSDEDGNWIFGGMGEVETLVENARQVLLSCKGEGLVNLSGRAQSFRGFGCGILPPSGGGVVLTEESHATVAADGNGSMTCRYRFE